MESLPHPYPFLSFTVVQLQEIGLPCGAHNEPTSTLDALGIVENNTCFGLLTKVCEAEVVAYMKCMIRVQGYFVSFIFEVSGLQTSSTEHSAEVVQEI